MKMSNLDQRTLSKGLYQHYKGGHYEVIDTCWHSETEALLVLYRPQYGERKLWVRPYDMFVETLEHDGETVARFQLIEKTAD